MTQTQEPSSTSQDGTEPSVKDLLKQVYEMLDKIKIADNVQSEENSAHSQFAPVQADATSIIPSFSSQTSSSETFDSPTSSVHPHQFQIEQLEREVHRLKAESNELKGRIRTLELNYKNLLIELVAFQRGMAQQDSLIQALLSYFLGNRNSTSSVLTPDLSPSVSAIIPSLKPLTRSESKTHPSSLATFTLPQSLDQSPSLDSNNSNASITNLDDEAEMFDRLYRNLNGASSHHDNHPRKRRRDAENEEFTADTLPSPSPSV